MANESVIVNDYSPLRHREGAQHLWRSICACPLSGVPNDKKGLPSTASFYEDVLETHDDGLLPFPYNRAHTALVA